MFILYILIIAIITWLFLPKNKDSNIYSGVIENTWLKETNQYLPKEFQMKFGWGNGYAIIHRSHPLFSKTEYDVYLRVHGGLTLTESLYGFEKLYKIIADQGYYIRTPRNYWVFGFDTAHAYDDLDTCPKEYVEEETQALVNQLQKRI